MHSLTEKLSVSTDFSGQDDPNISLVMCCGLEIISIE